MYLFSELRASGLLMLLGISSAFAATVTVQMPNAEVLSDQLRAIGLEHFVEKSGIVERIAGQRLYALGVATAVEIAMHNYTEYLKRNMPAGMSNVLLFQMLMYKPLLFKTLLQDFPKESLEELRENGIYEPIQE